MMNLASILVICIVAGLLAFSIVRSRKNKADECSGGCGDCAFRCNRQK
ncbi:MAG: FeoB-associated Cys-rich membrane protein [Acetatifactor sp.]|nr:FeoB-associated Cys-rich membrane protein [Acetatifactor sp.]